MSQPRTAVSSVLYSNTAPGSVFFFTAHAASAKRVRFKTKLLLWLAAATPGLSKS